jgi:phage repressor protein C with HTH and peptisase S24 domain
MHRPFSLSTVQRLGDRVKAEREALGWSQAELGRRVVRAGYPSMSQVGIQKIESGDTKQPKCMTELAIALGLSANWLKTGRGDKKPNSQPTAETVPVRSYVGAGDEVFIIPEDEQPIDWVEPPPGMEGAEATIVRGRSGMPLYHDGDVLYHRRVVHDPIAFRGEVVVAQVKNGRRFVKLLERGKRKGLFNLVSINPAFPPLEDQHLDWIGPIEWVRKRRRY